MPAEEAFQRSVYALLFDTYQAAAQTSESLKKQYLRSINFNPRHIEQYDSLTLQFINTGVYRAFDEDPNTMTLAGLSLEHSSYTRSYEQFGITTAGLASTYKEFDHTFPATPQAKDEILQHVCSIFLARMQKDDTDVFMRLATLDLLGMSLQYILPDTLQKTTLLEELDQVLLAAGVHNRLIWHTPSPQTSFYNAYDSISQYRPQTPSQEQAVATKNEEPDPPTESVLLDPINDSEHVEESAAEVSLPIGEQAPIDEHIPKGIAHVQTNWQLPTLESEPSQPTQQETTQDVETQCRTEITAACASLISFCRDFERIQEEFLKPLLKEEDYYTVIVSGKVDLLKNPQKTIFAHICKSTSSKIFTQFKNNYPTLISDLQQTRDHVERALEVLDRVDNYTVYSEARVFFQEQADTSLSGLEFPMQIVFRDLIQALLWHVKVASCTFIDIAMQNEEELKRHRDDTEILRGWQLKELLS